MSFQEVIHVHGGDEKVPVSSSGARVEKIVAHRCEHPLSLSRELDCQKYVKVLRKAGTPINSIFLQLLKGSLWLKTSIASRCSEGRGRGGEKKERLVSTACTCTKCLFILP